MKPWNESLKHNVSSWVLDHLPSWGEIGITPCSKYLGTFLGTIAKNLLWKMQYLNGSVGRLLLRPLLAHPPLVQLSTILRAATPEEKASVTSRDDPPRGLHVREDTADSILGILARLKSVEGMSCRVGDLKRLIHPSKLSPSVCDLTMLSFAKSRVELGALALVTM